MDLIDFKHSLNNHVIEQDIKSKILAKLNLIPNLPLLKLDTELTLYCCNVVENMVIKLNKIDKKQLVIDIIHILFNLKPEEKLILGNQIEFLFNNKKIKIASFYKKVSKSFIPWIMKKLF